jgi:hydrogenase maturation protein HypF
VARHEGSSGLPGGGASARKRVRVRVEGIVQGVGFRPFVYTHAVRLGLGGFVANDALGVILEAEGSPASLEQLVDALRLEPPTLAVVERIRSRPVAARGETGFAIVASAADGERRAPISPDIATCDDCLREIFDARDRRHGYAFTNCANCGPRFTIVRGVPYDRPLTTMAGFAMCSECVREYHDPADRRFHAEPISCPACGPRLWLLDARGELDLGDPIERTVERLREGAIVAIKGLGGYHLAALANHEAAVARLRASKHREEKPFAVMVRDLGAARRLVEIDPAEAAALSSPRRPIVLLRRRRDAPVAPRVAPHNRSLGLMLPYTALHHLLAARLEGPFVLTSGNVSDEPIVYRDEDVRARLGGIADAFLQHDRAIHLRTDDSVVRVFRGRETAVRRSRGYAPRPLLLPCGARRPILACGAELKSTFCLVKGERAFLSHHIGDLENFATLTAFREGVEHFRRLFDVAPEIVAYDLHPEYLSTKYALELRGVERVGVQHHHAHVGACLADNSEEGPVIGVALDGLGFGLDGTLWGGEFLVADLNGFERAGHFEAVPMPGGAQAIREPWRMAAVYLEAAFGEAIPADLAVRRRNDDRWARVLHVARCGRFSPETSSVGRLFDAVAALVGVRDSIRYEAQAAIELEQLADPSERAAYRGRFTPSAPHRVRGADFVAAAAADLLRGVPPHTIAARFHNGLADLITEVCAAIRAERGLSSVALSGGVFQNSFLLERTVAALEHRGFRALTHCRVPPNDGGVSFGQAAIAAARQNRVQTDRADAFAHH